VKPFYQWENNDGYCGEVSLIHAGMANGQFMSQFNERLVCGTGLSQSGVPGACAAHNNVPNYNAQVLIEDPGTGVSGPNPYADAALCAANARLAAVTFPYETAATGKPGYQQYMSWIKAQVIAGRQVTIGVLLNGGSDPQYDHEVSVLMIGTNHAPDDPTYYPDDVLYFDDHGVYTLSGTKWGKNPAIPPGAGDDTVGCTPYVYGYPFASLAQTRAGANRRDAQGYSIILPAAKSIQVYTGGNGYKPLTVTGPHDFAISVSGPVDTSGETLPVAVQIAAATTTKGTPNPMDPIAGWNYENPMIGKNLLGNSCTDKPPSRWMGKVVLEATATGLTPGIGYNLYEYEFSNVSGTGTGAALAVPTGNFNANASMAKRVTGFTAIGTTFATSVTVTSDKIVVFRAVPASAP
jgi:hypothetical protein